MSVFWFLIWFVLSAILLGASVWSLLILLRQKKAWESFATMHKLIFSRGTFMGPAEISGMIDEYKVAFYTAERQSTDVRKKRYVSVIELTAPEGLFDGGVAGTQEMLTFMQSLQQVHFFKIEVEGWDETHRIFVREDLSAAAYFTPDKLDVFANILKTRNADVFIVFTNENYLVRLETTDPMQDADKIEKVVLRIKGLMERMAITGEERQRISALAQT